MRSGMARMCLYDLGLATMMCAMGGHPLAGGVSVPEIDGGSLVAGLGLLTGAVLVLRSRRRSK